MSSLAPALLLSMPQLVDPNFNRTVVLLCKHSEEGAFGLVVNRPLITTGRVIVNLDPPVTPDHDLQVWIGGPVEPQAAVVVADFADPDVAEIIALDSIGFLPPETGPEIKDGIRRARVFAGYAGWGSGQLEREMVQDSWIVEPARPDDVFAADPARLWADVLKRKGPAFDLLRLMPLDPTLN